MPTETAAPHTHPKVSPLEYAEILQFYAEQMHHLDTLDIEAYAATFTALGVIAHRHADQVQRGRQEIIDHATSVLPTYRQTGARHWNGDYLVRRAGDAKHSYYDVQYASLVTHRASEGSGGVAFKEPFVVTDTLVREGDTLRIDRRVIEQP